MPAMQFMSASLGVDCDHCHVEHAPEKDDKHEKQVARKMIAMTRGLVRDTFEGRREVTCFTCHQGGEHPRSIPPVATSNDEPPPEPTVDASLTAEAVLDKFLASVGGAEALAKIKSRVQKGTMAGFGPERMPIEVYSAAPDKRLSVVKTPRGESLTAFDGKSGWLGSSGRPARDMSASEADGARLDADFYLAQTVKQRFEKFDLRPTDTIGGMKVLPIRARRTNLPPVDLYFAADSGQLVRLVRYLETPLGRLPTQVDYSDYRAVDGVTIPFKWSVSRPSGTFEVAIDEVQQNQPIDLGKFTKPAGP